MTQYILLKGQTSYQGLIDNEFELRTDFKFRYDFAQFAMRQPLTWHWNNRMFRFGSRYNRYNYWNPYYPYSQNYNFTYTSTQMWNDWLWGMDSGYWWNNWNTNHNNWYNGIIYGWNNYYGWGWIWLE